jgi:hypothetical protein
VTAVIAILNKSGVALAADSAVTYEGPNGRKILNTANKIFTLSKFNPVGIMIYNSATFMDVPWEVLIKEYRRRLKDRHYDHLIEYQTSFIEFISNKLELVNETYRESIKAMMFEAVVTGLLEEVKNGKQEQEDLRTALHRVVNDYLTRTEAAPILPAFQDYPQAEFLERNKDVIDKATEKIKPEIEVDEDTHVRLRELIYRYTSTGNFDGAWSGLVFAGYGDKELYPRCVSLKIGEAIDSRVRFEIQEHEAASVGINGDAFIKPFAQRDVIDMLLSGIDLELNSIYLKSFAKFLDRYSRAIRDLLQSGGTKINDDISSALNTSSLAEQFARFMKEVREKKHVRPTMETIASLSKEDLAEMAESLIYLTYLKRRISSSEESVGGPVDVAIVSKGDGFIWLKRKHYFRPELNHNFVSNYLRV